ncbi:uncharacterized protein K452DRAFT_290644 [Aplosporella prunicola CBS 121167]|uniref:HAD superfamily hydrolase n=1 Tax=Aplosporella prunicola CBS 121167 TaxID=1176127 RepID=A0A6A6B5I7_9PEZI|nr:uncharacterized protein K452DRAFT_290644 [Aplosporella prunicola CBS 121167]KAF2138504.1 hypothetical protein K452DRAFT_290644 [Aplosporella prunicola CBS 121167]
MPALVPSTFSLPLRTQARLVLHYSQLVTRFRFSTTIMTPLQSSSSSSPPSTSQRPRRFAPLDPESVAGKEWPRLRGVVFDVDGTLCEPQNYMFAEMRTALSIPPKADILTHIAKLPPSNRADAENTVRAIEARAMASQKPSPGLAALMQYLTTRAVPKAICTRNHAAPVAHLLSTFLPPSERFAPIMTRDDFVGPQKPDPAGILHAAEVWGLRGEEGGASGLIMVGDGLDDMTAGFRAGAATVLLVNEFNAHLAGHQHTDLVVRRLDELVEVLERGFVGQVARDDESPDTKAQAEEALERV